MLTVSAPGGGVSAPSEALVSVFADKTKTVFVSNAGTDGAAGTRGAPLAKVQEGITAAAKLGTGAGVYV